MRFVRRPPRYRYQRNDSRRKGPVLLEAASSRFFFRRTVSARVEGLGFRGVGLKVLGLLPPSGKQKVTTRGCSFTTFIYRSYMLGGSFLVDFKTIPEPTSRSVTRSMVSHRASLILVASEESFCHNPVSSHRSRIPPTIYSR